MAESGTTENETIYDSGGLGELLFSSLRRYGHRVIQFLDDTNEINTYSDLLIRSIRTAINLQKLGILRNEIISCCTHNHKDSCVPFLAAQFVGAIPSYFDPNLSHLDTIHLLKLIQPKILFVSKDIVEFMESCLQKAIVSTKIVVFGQNKKYTQFSEFLKYCTDEEKFIPVKIQNKQDTAVILFSSGTTGLPKGICLNHKSLMKASNSNDLKFSLNNNCCIMLMFSTLYWISAVFSLIKCISNGYSMVVRRDFNPEYTWKLIEKYKVSTIFLPPYNAVDLLKHRPNDVDVSSLKIFLTGSCPVTKKLMEELNEAFPQAKIIHAYGSSEMAGCVTYLDPNNADEYRMQVLKPTSCGKIRCGFKFKIVDTNTEKILGPNEEGEIRLKGKYIMNGYYKTDSSSAFDSEGYIKTGDLGYYDNEDCFYIVGRIKEMFKFRGCHILPPVIEEVLTLHPAVKEAAVIGIPHEVDGEHPMGIVVLYKGYDHVTADDIKTFVNEKVSENQKLRAGLKIVESLPKTATGKIKRIVLRDYFVNN